MAKTKHKLHIKSSSGAEETVALFTDINDLKNKSGKEIIVYETEGKKRKGITLYYPVGEVGDPEQTSARIKDKNGNIKAILKYGTPAYTQKLLTVPKASAGGKSDYSGIFIVPAGVSRLRIALCPARLGYNWVEDETYDNYSSGHHEFKVGSDTKFGKITAQTNGTKLFRYGCKGEFSFTKRNSYNASATDFYSCASDQQYQYLTNENYSAQYSDLNNKFYVGYMDVEPQQQIKYTIGAKTGKQNDPKTCGFILIAYGIGIEK